MSWFPSVPVHTQLADVLEEMDLTFTHRTWLPGDPHPHHKETTVTDEFAGERPYDIAEAYHRGKIDRDEVILQLTTWSYRPAKIYHDPLGWDPPVIEDDGEFEEVVAAYRRGLIEGDVYDEFLDALAEEDAST